MGGDEVRVEVGRRSREVSWAIVKPLRQWEEREGSEQARVLTTLRGTRMTRAVCDL